MNLKLVFFSLLCFCLPLGLMIDWSAIMEEWADISPEHGRLLYFYVDG
ncbi:MAG TPA: hypothetical protein PKD64_06290 [Pirellulaceae bacterium]|nr:hypothetical protein [Pirellulaceae bacterium]HMO91790.1 hypothetical protein [Pirellulaceae bacterium]HMP69589.1 hypothetical protein [Pirellulaceae bacterium]